MANVVGLGLSAAGTAWAVIASVTLGSVADAFMAQVVGKLSASSAHYNVPGSLSLNGRLAAFGVVVGAALLGGIMLSLLTMVPFVNLSGNESLIAFIVYLSTQRVALASAQAIVSGQTEARVAGWFTGWL